MTRELRSSIQPALEGDDAMLGQVVGVRRTAVARADATHREVRPPGGQRGLSEKAERRWAAGLAAAEDADESDGDRCKEHSAVDRQEQGADGTVVPYAVPRIVPGAPAELLDDGWVEVARFTFHVADSDA